MRSLKTIANRIKNYIPCHNKWCGEKKNSKLLHVEQTSSMSIYFVSDTSKKIAKQIICEKLPKYKYIHFSPSVATSIPGFFFSFWYLAVPNIKREKKPWDRGCQGSIWFYLKKFLLQSLFNFDSRALCLFFIPREKKVLGSRLRFIVSVLYFHIVFR